MSDFNVVRRCYGCGAILQSDDPSAHGYIEKKNIEKSPISAPLFCEHCWKQTKYNILPKAVEASEDYLTMLADAQASDATIVYVIDLFSFETSFIEKASALLEGLNILVLANKRDLLPKSTSDEALKRYVMERFRKSRLDVPLENILLVSLRFASDVNEIAERIQTMRKGHDVYVIGALSSGKTIFTNAFLRTYRNPSNRSIVSKPYHKTSLRVLTVPLDSSSSLYDTPGTSLENSLVTHVDPVTAYALMPKDEVKARRFVLLKGEGIFFGKFLARIDLIEGKPTPVAVYASPEVPLSKKIAKLSEQALLSFAKQFGKENTKGMPIAANDFDAFELKVDDSSPRDIGIEGLGWISFKGEAQTFRIYVPKGVALYTSHAKITKSK